MTVSKQCTLYYTIKKMSTTLIYIIVRLNNSIQYVLYWSEGGLQSHILFINKTALQY